ncbi:MAG: trigger factor [Caulobacterales bacterium]
MEVCQTKSEGLSRMYQVTVGASELAEKLNAKIAEAAPQINLKGFRPGKAPASHIKRLYGPSIMKDVIDQAVQEGTQKAIEDNKIRVAQQPHIHLEGEYEEIASGKADLAFHFHVEVMPEFTPANPADLEVTKLVAEVPEDLINERLMKLAESNRSFSTKDGPAADGDSLTVDFEGFIDDVAFEGGKAEGAELVIGAGRFIPGFEEQLVGASAGETKTLTVTFPADYPAENLAGKEARFEVAVKEVKAPEEAKVDEELAKRFGLEGLDPLKNAVKMELENEHRIAQRTKLKKSLLDAIDTAHSFDLPPNMLENEFQDIWRQVQQEKEAGRLDEEDKAKSDEDLEASYRKIAERRVRLGLVLAETGRINNIQLRDEEVARALNNQARRYPGQEKQVIEFYRKTPGALAQIQAPLYEEKVVDFILELAKVTEKTVSRDELLADDDSMPS